MQKNRLRKIGTVTVIAALITGIACFTQGRLEETASGTEADAIRSRQTFRYIVALPETVALTTELPGRVSAFMVSEVRPQVSGIITERLFVEGSDVARGQVLYQIDPDLFEASFQSAKAALAKAEAIEVSSRLLADRYGKIVKTNAVSRQDHDDAIAAHRQARADVEAAKQSLETARINLGYTKVRAPVSGRISRSLVTPGALATQHQADPFATIQQLDKVYVDVTHSNSELLKLRRALAMGELRSGGADAARVKLRLEDGSGYARLPATPGADAIPEEIEGDLLFSEVTIDKSTGAVTIRALFDNPDKILLPGMYVRALLEEGRRDGAILVPQRLVMRDIRGRAYVYVLTRQAPPNTVESRLSDDDFYVAMRHVRIDRRYDNMWLIASGIEPGDRILAEGLQKARPGLVVTGAALSSPDAVFNNDQAR